MNAFTLKIIALTTMLIDHIGAVFFPDMTILRVIGRIAFPIFVYLVAEGFRHTSSPVKFLARLGAFAIISEIPFDLAFNFHWSAFRQCGSSSTLFFSHGGVDFFANTNIFYMLFLGGVAIVAYEALKNKSAVLSLVPVLGCMALAVLLSADYGAYGVIFVFCMYIIRDFRWRLAAMALLCVWQHEGLILWGLQHHIPLIYWMMVPATLLPVVLIAFYNGKRGWGLKWFFYAAYPLHLLVFGVMSACWDCCRGM